MSWVVMRRDGERNVRVEDCVTEAAAEAVRQTAARTYAGEDCWIESDEPKAPPPQESQVIPQVVPHDTWVSVREDRLPEARVVSALPPVEPRHVPWQATIFMIGPTIAVISAVLFAGGAVCGMFTSDRHPIHVFGPQIEHVLDTLAMEWMSSALVLIGAAAFYQWRFLRRARVVEGVMKDGQISISIEGADHRVTSIAPAIADGTHVPMFWRGRRLVELSKAGAELAADGEVSWTAKPLPYPFAAAWPAAGLGLVAVVIAMMVTFVLAAVA